MARLHALVVSNDFSFPSKTSPNQTSHATNFLRVVLLFHVPRHTCLPYFLTPLFVPCRNSGFEYVHVRIQRSEEDK